MLRKPRCHFETETIYETKPDSVVGTELVACGHALTQHLRFFLHSLPPSSSPSRPVPLLSSRTCARSSSIMVTVTIDRSIRLQSFSHLHLPSAAARGDTVTCRPRRGHPGRSVPPPRRPRTVDPPHSRRPAALARPHGTVHPRRPSVCATTAACHYSISSRVHKTSTVAALGRCSGLINTFALLPVCFKGFWRIDPSSFV